MHAVVYDMVKNALLTDQPLNTLMHGSFCSSQLIPDSLAGSYKAALDDQLVACAL